MGVCVCVFSFSSSSCHISTNIFGNIARFFDWVLACNHKYERILKLFLPFMSCLEPNLAKFYYAWLPAVWLQHKYEKKRKTGKL